MTGMPPLARYRFLALDSNGVKVQGLRTGSDTEDVTRALANEGLFPVRVAQFKHAGRRRLPGVREDAVTGLGSLATLLVGGLKPGRALAAMEDLAPPSWRPWIPEIRSRLRQGSSLSDALLHADLGIPLVAAELIRSGDLAGDLAGGVRRAAHYAEEQRRLQSALLSSLAYPLLLFCAAAASTGVLVGIVIPRFAEMLAETGAPLPRSTQLLLAGSRTLRTAVLPLLALAALGVFAVRELGRDERKRLRMEELLMRLPLVGSVRFQMASSRVACAIAELLRSGTTIATALTNAARASGNASTRDRVLRARERVIRGESTSSALAMERAVTDLTLRFLRAGEESGTTADMLMRAAEYEEGRARATMARVTKLLEPLMILAFGGVIAFVAASLLQAVYAFRAF